jgi:hypothetical protein
MVNSSPNNALHVEMQWGRDRRCPGKVTAIISFNNTKNYKGEMGWKALLSIPLSHQEIQVRRRHTAIRNLVEGRKKRVFGNWRATMVEAGNHILELFAHRVVPDELSRVHDRIQTMQTLRCQTQHHVTMLTAPGHGDTKVPNHKDVLAPGPVSEASKFVTKWKKIYGLFGNGKEMSPLFLESRMKWTKVAGNMGANYHLWNAAEVESLVQDPLYWH